MTFFFSFFIFFTLKLLQLRALAAQTLRLFLGLFNDGISGA
jgi:hypothetical protein